MSSPKQACQNSSKLAVARYMALIVAIFARNEAAAEDLIDHLGR
jgi:hypothetical protein